MPNGNNPFDLIDDFKNAGFQQGQAESLARVFADVEFQNVATKQDIKELDYKIELIRKDIESIRRDVKSMGNAVIVKLTGIMAALMAIFRFLPEILN